MERNRIVRNESVQLGGVMLESSDPAAIFRIAQNSVCRVSLIIEGREIGHGSSFLYKQVIDKATSGSRLFFFTNAHVIHMILEAYEVLPLVCDGQTIKSCQTELTVTFKDRQYPINIAWMPKLYQQKNDDHPFMGDYAIFFIDTDDASELDFFSIFFRTLDILCGGQDIYACGYPGPAGMSVRKGIISNLDIATIIQHDVMINPGDSGGPTILNSGQIVGISVGGIDYRKFVGINYSIDIRHVLEVVRHTSNMECMDIQKIFKQIREDVEFSQTTRW